MRLQRCTMHKVQRQITNYKLGSILFDKSTFLIKRAGRSSREPNSSTLSQKGLARPVTQICVGCVIVSNSIVAENTCCTFQNKVFSILNLLIVLIVLCRKRKRYFKEILHLPCEIQESRILLQFNIFEVLHICQDASFNWRGDQDNVWQACQVHWCGKH